MLIANMKPIVYSTSKCIYLSCLGINLDVNTFCAGGECYQTGPSTSDHTQLRYQRKTLVKGQSCKSKDRSLQKLPSLEQNSALTIVYSLPCYHKTTNNHVKSWTTSDRNLTVTASFKIISLDVTTLKGQGHKISSSKQVQYLSWFLNFQNAPLMRCRHCHLPRGLGEIV